MPSIITISTATARLSDGEKLPCHGDMLPCHRPGFTTMAHQMTRTPNVAVKPASVSARGGWSTVIRKNTPIQLRMEIVDQLNIDFVFFYRPPVTSSTVPAT